MLLKKHGFKNNVGNAQYQYIKTYTCSSTFNNYRKEELMHVHTWLSFMGISFIKLSLCFEPCYHLRYYHYPVL